MKRHTDHKDFMIRVLSYIILVVFIIFLLFLLEPLFPGFVKDLNKLSLNIKKFLHLNINTGIISLVVFLIAFFVFYSLLAKMAEIIRKNREFIWKTMDPNIRYRSRAYFIFKVILTIIFIPLIYGFTKGIIWLLKYCDFRNKRFYFFALGFVLFTIIWLLFWKKMGFFCTFEHEFTHMLIALPFLHKPTGFHVEEHKGGWVRLARVNFLITLAPYFFLTFCFLLLPFYLIIKPQFYSFYFLLMGICVSYHTFSTIQETRFNRQPDIIFNGKLFSFVVILLGNLFCYGYILAFVIGGFDKGGNFISVSWTKIIRIAKIIFS